MERCEAECRAASSAPGDSGCTAPVSRAAQAIVGPAAPGQCGRMFVVLGNVAVDESMAAPAWPVPGATVLVGPPHRDLGGKGGNQALILGRCGVDMRLVATIGDDDNGRWIAATLAAEGVATHGLIRIEGPSDRSLIFVGASGENAIASTSICSDALTPQHVATALAGARPDDVIVLQGGLTLAANAAACQAAARLGLRVVFNPSAMRPGFETLVPSADLLVLNAIEAGELTGEGEPMALAQRLHEQGAGDVVVTMGAAGAVCAGRSGRFAVPAAQTIVRDTTGAGDTYLGVLSACCIAHDMPMERAMRCAALAAAITVSRPGTRGAFPTAAELAAIIASS